MSDLLKKEAGGGKGMDYMELLFYLVMAWSLIRGNAVFGESTGREYLTYTMNVLAMLEIWCITTVYHNLFGSIGIAERTAALINSFLLLPMATGMERYMGVGSFMAVFAIAWALLLIHMGIQFLIKVFTFQMDVREFRYIRRLAWLLVAQGAVIIATGYFIGGNQWMSIQKISIAVWFAAFLFLEYIPGSPELDTGSLTEQLPRFVVLSFGMAMTGIAGVILDGFSGESLAYGIVVFLCLAALLVICDYYSRRMLNRQRLGKGHGYLVAHAVLLFALSFITEMFIFKRYGHVLEGPEPHRFYQSLSVILFLAAVFAISRYTDQSMINTKTLLLFLAAALVYFGLMYRFSGNWMFNGLCTAGFIGLAFMYISGVRIKLEVG